jgi:hypothetical protein
MRAHRLAALVYLFVMNAACGDLYTGGIIDMPDAGPGDDAASAPDSSTSPPDACGSVCSGRCTDLTSDSTNCGACGNACPPSASCAQGACVCGRGQQMCGGICKDLTADPRNCGACGNVCGAAKPPLVGGGVWACQASACVVVCSGSLGACDDGCHDLTSDQDHCGKCGTACGGSTTCCSGACSDTSTDTSNCGACGSACSGTCSAGTCCQTPTTGSCSHALCSSGSALSSSCDGSQGCVAKVCGSDPYCCSTKWDSYCAAEVETHCSPLKCSC